ncbi:unnamed protein product [Albugo candida]|nr:unnamed protein product [Albugo candida]|eukprot:CCI50012.1 unnamed protein product [Albugo candida]
MTKYPSLKPVLQALAQIPMARWYTDQRGNIPQLAKEVYLDVCDSVFKDLNKTLNCLSLKPIRSTFDEKVIIVYGLPNKDCKDKFSSFGGNKNAEDYKTFIKNLVDGNVNKKKVVYILEPDAIGLLAVDGCAAKAQYGKNLATAIDLLVSDHSNVFIDIGFWTLSNDSDAQAVAKIVKSVDPDQKCTGIALNTANYRSVEEMHTYCERYRKAIGRDVQCIIDTSRNNLPPSPIKEWCNYKKAGIGRLPTKKVKYKDTYAYSWLKIAGESDGECTGRTSDSLPGGPPAGDFFPQAFVNLWNNGIYVTKFKYPKVSLTKPWTSPKTGKACY